jgi:hypothetical protein
MQGEVVKFRFHWKVLGLFAIWWIILQLFAILIFNRIHLTEPDTAYRWTSQPSNFSPVTWHSFADLHHRWDSGFYVWIAMSGYNADNAAFLPLYPLLVRFTTLLGYGIGRSNLDVSDFIDSAFLISNLSALGAAICIYVLARLDLDESQAERALLYFLIFPTAFFLTANYTESLFILLASLSFYVARKSQWIAASGIGALAMLTRMAGSFLFVALLVEWLLQRPAKRWKAIGLLLMPMAFAIHEFYLRSEGLSFFRTQEQLFSRLPVNIWALPFNLDWAYVQTHPAAQVNLALDVGIGLFVVVISIIIAKRWRSSYGVYGIMCILIPLMSGHATSLNRYALIAFPVPLMLARYGHSVWLDCTYTFVAILLLAIYTTLFVQGYWAG